MSSTLIRKSLSQVNLCTPGNFVGSTTSIPSSSKNEMSITLSYTGNDPNQSFTQKNIICKIKSWDSKVLLQCSPLDGFNCTGRFWRLTVNVHYNTITGIEETSHQQDMTFHSKRKCFFLAKLNSVDETRVEVQLSNIRTIGIRNFPKKVFGYPDTTTDLVIHHGDRILFCHSQVLSLSSNVISEMITSKKPSLKIDLSSLIPLYDLVELLHYIYFPIDVVDESNLETLLHWSYTFNVTSILHVCKKSMDSEWESSLMDRDRRVELFLLSWSYDLETSLVDYFHRVFRSTIYNPERNDPNSNSFQLEKIILQHQLYQTMHKKNKLLLSELILAMGSSELEF